jgi:hypothetical protein
VAADAGRCGFSSRLPAGFSWFPQGAYLRGRRERPCLSPGLPAWSTGVSEIRFWVELGSWAGTRDALERRGEEGALCEAVWISVVGPPQGGLVPRGVRLGGRFLLGCGG